MPPYLTEVGYYPEPTSTYQFVCFDDGSDDDRVLDGKSVSNINVDLTSAADLTLAKPLAENRDVAFQGVGMVGAFDIPEVVAVGMLSQQNPHGKPNSEVVRRWVTGTDLTKRFRNIWVIDFGIDRSESEAALYEAPFEYVLEHVKPIRISNNNKWRAENWWLHGSRATNMRMALSPLQRYIGTPKVSKHRFFVWLTADILPSNLVVAFASDDDYVFGVLHSRLHTVWSLAIGTQLEDRPTYIPTACFRTFPFPHPSPEQRQAIADAARELNRLRENWRAADSKRTLTNLYNSNPTWLQNTYAKLDTAVADAYDWSNDQSDQQILENILALNLQRHAEE